MHRAAGRSENLREGGNQECGMGARDRPRFFDQVGHQTTDASIGNKHFSLNNDLIRLTKIINNLVKDLEILSFKVIFQCLKLVKSFQKKIL